MKKSVSVPSRGKIKAIGVEVYWDAKRLEFLDLVAELTGVADVHV